MRCSWICALALLLTCPCLWAEEPEDRDSPEATTTEAAESDEAESEPAEEGDRQEATPEDESTDEPTNDADAKEDDAPSEDEKPEDPSAEGAGDDPDASAAPDESKGIDLTDPESLELIRKISYIFGANVGRNIKGEGLDLDMKIFIEGLKDMVEGRKAKYDVKEMQETIEAFELKMLAKRAEQTKALGAKNKAAGEAFLAANKKKPGVKTLPSGLQYKVLKSGDKSSRSPKRTDTVTTHYKGTLIDGTVFDSSYDRKMPASFPVEGVIAGWTEALQLMKVGDVWRLFVPANLAYGADSRGPVIGPHSTLVFEIELQKIGK